ncbi:MAG: serine/threonine-protein kinase, partial [Gemmataceae bacterium]
MSRVSPTPTDADATLPPPPAAAETLAPSASSPVAAGAPTVPGYELLRELGRGGMGVVYQARDLKLNRVVALKMILAGGHASAAEMVRFLAEAEAVAALQHPHIVAIYEVGRHDNLPYFTLEFCPGGSLADRVKDAPLSPQAAAHVVEQVARGVAFAHGRGIVHRDLKPENVLFADDGTPKITDFGLAKRLATGAGLTATGAVLGTPSYMAPEQAAGRKEVGPAADVYALGAILYRLLAGRPPFQAATALDTVMQVVSEEAVPLRRLNGQVPRDLETICQKCLHKDARKRYATAEALADDLRRFQESEPIAARPIGLLERGVKWTRRHPARAAFINSLMLGLVISTGLAIQATTNADRARRNEADANTARRDLEAANTDLSRQREDLSTSRDKLEQSLASSMLRPFRVEPGPLTESEIEALRELARSEGGGLRVRFVREAVKSPSATHQLANRAAVALHSAVGLDQTRREAIERALAGRLDGSTPAAERFDIALALARLGDLSPDVHQRAVKELLESKSAHMDANTSGATAAALIALANRRPPADAAAILLKALGQTPHPAAVHELAAAVAAHAARLEPAIAAPIAAQAVAAVIAALEKTTGYSSENPLLFEAFTLLAALLGPQDARAIVEQTVAKLTRPAAQNER